MSPPIANGSAILEADLDAQISTALAVIRTDNGQLPGGLEVHLTFPNLVGGGGATPLERRKFVFPVPFDCYVEVIAGEHGDATNPSTLTVDLAAIASIGGTVVTDPLSLWSMNVSGAVAGTGHVPRVLYDGTKTKVNDAFTTTSRAHRTLLKGSTLQVTVSTTNLLTPSMCHVVLVLREFFAREAT